MDRACQNLDNASLERAFVSAPVTRGEYRVGQAMFKCPVESADAMARGIVASRAISDSVSFDFWRGMAFFVVDSVVYDSAIAVLEDTTASDRARSGAHHTSPTICSCGIVTPTD